ncbi:MAG: efflux RND transporter periplasmic adaptor subunit [Legionellaceae bacterium]|nr:efflux RND transporter periplasmic adaptor subunit [Legionellaceae bacterium]
MTKRILSILLLLTVMIVLVFYYYWSQQNTGQNGYSAPLLPVEVSEVRHETITESLEAVATTRAWESITISANVTEYVKKLHFEDGDEVRKGDVLVELETAEEMARLAEAQARLLEANQQYDRIKNLLQRKFSAQSEYDTQKANIESAQARIDQINSYIADRTIKAPFDGVLGFRLISQGTLVQPGDSIVTLDMIQPLRLDFSVPERYLSEIKVGTHFSADSIAFPDTSFSGHIRTINSRIDEQSRTILLRGVLENPQHRLKPGMLMHITLPLASRKVLIIPEESLMAQGDERYVYVIDPSSNRAQKRAITLLQRKGNRLWVAGELKEGEWVATKGAFRIRDGQEISTPHVHQ